MPFKYVILILLIICFTNIRFINANEYKYTFNDNCINEYYAKAKYEINSSEITILREAIGIIIRFEIENPWQEYKILSSKTINLLNEIEYFLAKIKKPAIIEVHTEVFTFEKRRDFKNWELSTVIANNIESYLIQKSNVISKNNISSIGYGEFMPAKNTPNNGGKYSNRVDIIIPCSISGE